MCVRTRFVESVELPERERESGPTPPSAKGVDSHKGCLRPAALVRASTAHLALDSHLEPEHAQPWHLNRTNVDGDLRLGGSAKREGTTSQDSSTPTSLVSFFELPSPPVSRSLCRTSRILAQEQHHLSPSPRDRQSGAPILPGKPVGGKSCRAAVALTFLFLQSRASTSQAQTRRVTRSSRPVCTLERPRVPSWLPNRAAGQLLRTTALHRPSTAWQWLRTKIRIRYVAGWNAGEVQRC